MSPDEEKRIRQLLLMKRKLPQPDWDLFARTSRRWSVLRDPTQSIESQARIEQGKEIVRQRELTRDASLKAKAIVQDEKETQKKQQKLVKERLAFRKDIENENKKLNKLKHVPDILKRAEVIRTMEQNYEGTV